MMKPFKAAKTIAQTALDPFEALGSNLVRPMGEEALRELGFFGSRNSLRRNPQEMAKEDLQRAREDKKVKEMDEEDSKNSEQTAQQIHTKMQEQYKSYLAKTNQEQKKLQEEVMELKSEVVKLAQAAGVETKVHLETTPKKIGVLDIRRLTTIIRFLRIKAEESKSAKELVTQRANAKPATGMLAWVSGKQMKIHEQGTLQLQG